MSDRDIIPPELAIQSMRDSGYRDASHALAELVDNAVEAGAKNIEIVCTDKHEFVERRQRRRVDQIAVIDNGCGMTKDVLQLALQFGNGTHLNPEAQTGIGKFGMGLPNSSISQCQRVEVWSWRDGKCHYSYLDVEEIKRGELKTVPTPKQAPLPKEILKLAKTPKGPSGTLVLWSQLDRVRWKSSKSLLENSEFLIGRIYRHFIVSKEVAIRLAAYSKTPTGEWQTEYDKVVLPNDPLNLMVGTSCPELPDPYTGQAMFTPFGPDSGIDVTLPGDRTSHQVVIRYAIVRSEIRKALGQGNVSPGSTAAGMYVAKNIGISLVRAGRELELSKAHVIGYNPTERWWGIEVSFPPALDEIFGVSNNKQAATAFGVLDLEEDARAEGMKPGEYFDSLKDQQDPRWVMYEISKRIHANVTSMRAQLERMREGTRKRELPDHPDPVEVAATKVTEQRKESGHHGQSDAAEGSPADQRAAEISKELEQQGADAESAREIAITHVQNNIKYLFQTAPYQGPSFFSIASRGGAIIVTVNQAHPASPLLLGLLEASSTDTDSEALRALKLMLCAWARLEDETRSDKLRQQYVDVRDEWGRMARQFLAAASED